MRIRILTFALLLITLSTMVRGQALDPETAGRHYVLAFPDTTGNRIDTDYPSPLRDTFALWIYSAIDNTVRIQGPGYDRTVHPKGGQFEIVYLDDSVMEATKLIIDSAGRISNRVFRVDSDEPMILYCYMVTQFGGEAWTPVAVENWGTEYYAASLQAEVMRWLLTTGFDNYFTRNKGEGAQICVIAAYDSTTVRLFPTDTLLGHPDTVVTLMANQAYLVRTGVDIDNSRVGLPKVDIAGTKILSDKPVGVISGNTRAMGNVEDSSGFMRNAFKNLLAEWLTPVEQLGREFVYLPTWDAQRITGEPGENLANKRKREVVRIYGTGSGGTAINVVDSITRYLGAITQSQVLTDSVHLPRPRIYRAGEPVQAMMTSTSIGQYQNNPNPNISPQNSVSGTYIVWSPYMVSLIPREQWSDFAPYYAPLYPINMEHYVNIVADTASARTIVDETGKPVVLDRVIEGTEYVWTTLSVVPGVTHYLKNTGGSATFFAFAYGLAKGREAFGAQQTKKKDDPLILGGGHVRTDIALFDQEYHEIVAISYGYPLAPRRTTLGEGDVLQIDPASLRCYLDLHAHATNQNPVGLRAVSLDSVVNARLEPVDPATFADIRGRSDVQVRVLPVDPLLDASATVVFTDRTGRRSTTPFIYRHEGGSLAAVNALDFGSVWVGTAVDTTITLKNIGSEDLCIGGLRVAHGGAGFSIVSDGGAPRTLKPGEEMIVTVRASPTSRDSVARDTILVKLCCGEVPIPVRTGVLSGVDSQPTLENGIALIQPNPTTERAKITVRLRYSSQVTIKIYRSTGELVREIYSGALGAGEHRMIWDATGEAAGGYRCQVQGTQWSGSAAIVVVR